MNNYHFKGLKVRTAVVRDINTGYILAFDPILEEEEEYYTYQFKWSDGKLIGGQKNFPAHTCCIIFKPQLLLVVLSDDGYYGILGQDIKLSGDIFEDSQPPPRRSGYIGFRSLSEIGGKAYAVGLRGIAYRLDDIKKWTRIDEGLPDSFNIQAIHGFDANELYAVGRHGELWQYDGQDWLVRELPTNVNLTSVRCTGDKYVYIAGHNGILIRGRNSNWEVLQHVDTANDIWDIDWFNGKVYLSTMSKVYTIENDKLSPVDFGENVRATCYQLSVAEGVMWSVGEEDIMSFNGSKWSRVL